MLDFLSALPVEKLSQILRLEIFDRVLELVDVDDRGVLWRQYSAFFGPAAVLKLLPGLRLDCLTVRTKCRDRPGLYDRLDGLIAQGNGWKELRFIAPNCQMLARHERQLLAGHESRRHITGAGPFRHRKPQPMHWQKVLEHCDGVASNPSAAIYLVPRSGWTPMCYGSHTTIRPDCHLACDTSPGLPANYERFEQTVPGHLTQETFALHTDEALRKAAEGKTMMIVVRRGARVDYQEKEGSPLADCWADIRKKWPGKTWQEINSACYPLWEVLMAERELELLAERELLAEQE